jgi:hypothetical protein
MQTEMKNSLLEYLLFSVHIILLCTVLPRNYPSMLAIYVNIVSFRGTNSMSVSLLSMARSWCTSFSATTVGYGEAGS